MGHDGAEAYPQIWPLNTTVRVLDALAGPYTANQPSSLTLVKDDGRVQAHHPFRDNQGTP